MTLAIRISLVVVSLALLGWGIFGESHAINPLAEGRVRVADGYDYTADATVDGYILKQGQLFDAYTPLTPGQVQLKDCKT